MSSAIIRVGTVHLVNIDVLCHFVFQHVKRLRPATLYVASEAVTHVTIVSIMSC